MILEASCSLHLAFGGGGKVDLFFLDPFGVASAECLHLPHVLVLSSNGEHVMQEGDEGFAGGTVGGGTDPSHYDVVLHEFGSIHCCSVVKVSEFLAHDVYVA